MGFIILWNLQVQRLTITVELQGIASSPGSTARATNSVMEFVALAKTTTLSASWCQPTHLSVFVDWFGDPLGIRVASDCLMEWINQDNLKEFIGGIFTHPVGVQYSQSSTVAASPFLER